MIFESLRHSSGSIFGALVFQLDFAAETFPTAPQIHLTQKPYMREKGLPGGGLCCAHSGASLLSQCGPGALALITRAP